jgi:pteridine reductase
MSNSKSKGTALVTGAAKRIGQAVALHLADQGYNIALHYHASKADAMKTAQAIYKKKVRCELFSANLADEAETKQLLPKVHKAFGDLNILVNSASIFIPNEFGDEDLSLYKAHWDINFKAPYLLSCAFNRLVRAGNIINFIDTNVVKHKTPYADYLLTKKALGAFTQMAAVEFGPKVRVNGISPGMILAPVNNQPDDRKKRAMKIPLQRPGDINCILQTVDYLLANEYITGQIIANDGGESLV